ncbi:hypothetical protein T265_14404, partial [Opisthorchis viverrini]
VSSNLRDSNGFVLIAGGLATRQTSDVDRSSQAGQLLDRRSMSRAPQSHRSSVNTFACSDVIIQMRPTASLWCELTGIITPEQEDERSNEDDVTKNKSEDKKATRRKCVLRQLQLSIYDSLDGRSTVNQPVCLLHAHTGSRTVVLLSRLITDGRLCACVRSWIGRVLSVSLFELSPAHGEIGRDSDVLDVCLGELRVQQLQTGPTTPFGFNVLVTFDNVYYESSGASAPVPTSTQERLVGFTCEECGKCCKSKAGFTQYDGHFVPDVRVLTVLAHTAP